MDRIVLGQALKVPVGMEEGGLNAVVEQVLVVHLERVGQPLVQRVQLLDVARVLRRDEHRRRELRRRVEQQRALEEEVLEQRLVVGRRAHRVADLVVDVRLRRVRAEAQPHDHLLDPRSGAGDGVGVGRGVGGGSAAAR